MSDKSIIRHRANGLRRVDFWNLGGELGQRGAGFLPFLVRPRGRRTMLPAEPFYPVASFFGHPVRQFRNGLGRDFRRVGAMTNQRQIVARLDREFSALA